MYHCSFLTLSLEMQTCSKHSVCYWFKSIFPLCQVFSIFCQPQDSPALFFHNRLHQLLLNVLNNCIPEIQPCLAFLHIIHPAEEKNSIQNHLEKKLPKQNPQHYHISTRCLSTYTACQIITKKGSTFHISLSGIFQLLED